MFPWAPFGLLNRNNSCFENAVLQALYSIEGFRSLMMSLATRQQESQDEKSPDTAERAKTLSYFTFLQSIVLLASQVQQSIQSTVTPVHSAGSSRRNSMDGCAEVATQPQAQSSPVTMEELERQVPTPDYSQMTKAQARNARRKRKRLIARLHKEAIEGSKPHNPANGTGDANGDTHNKAVPEPITLNDHLPKVAEWTNSKLAMLKPFFPSALRQILACFQKNAQGRQEGCFVL